MEKGEKTLVKRAMRGNPKAFGTLVEREQEYLYRMAFLYVRQEQDALDVVQESILKAYKSLKTLREPEYFRTWLTKIVINTAQDTLLSLIHIYGGRGAAHPGDGPAGRQALGADQRRRGHRPWAGGRGLDAPHRPHRRLCALAPHRVQRGGAGAPLPRHDRGLLPPAAGKGPGGGLSLIHI